jgi:hypothetical protein
LNGCGAAKSLSGAFRGYPELMTAADLRAKEAPPGTRETVAVSRGIKITLVYGDDGKVSRVEFPGGGPDGMREPVDEVLLELVPMSMRGEKVGGGLKEAGGRIRHTIYEHVMIFEREERPNDERSSVWVHFIAPHQSSSIS